MPIPKPEAGESSKDFIARCMANPIMEHEYPDAQQRAGVCYAQYEKRGKGASHAFATYSDKTQPSSRAAFEALKAEQEAKIKNRKVAAVYKGKRILEEYSRFGKVYFVEGNIKRAWGTVEEAKAAIDSGRGMSIGSEKYPDQQRVVSYAKKLNGYSGSDAKDKAARLATSLTMAGFKRTGQVKQAGYLVETYEDEDGDKVIMSLNLDGTKIMTKVVGKGYGRAFARKVGDWTMIGKTKASVEEVKAFLKKARINIDTTDLRIRRNGTMTELYVITANQKLVTQAEDAWAVSLFEAHGAYGRAFAFQEGAKCVGCKRPITKADYDKAQGHNYCPSCWKKIEPRFEAQQKGTRGFARAFARGNALLEFKDRATATKVWKQLIKAGIDYCMVQESDNGTFLLMAPVTELGTVRSALDKIPEARQGKRLSRAFAFQEGAKCVGCKRPITKADYDKAQGHNYCPSCWKKIEPRFEAQQKGTRGFGRAFGGGKSESELKAIALRKLGAGWKWDNSDKISSDTWELEFVKGNQRKVVVIDTFGEILEVENAAMSRAFGAHDAIIAKAKAAPNFEVATDILENAGFYPAEEGRNFIWWRKGNTWVKTVKGAGGKATITVDPSHKFNERNAPMNYSRAFGTGFEKAWKGKLDNASIEDLQEALERAFKDKIRYYDTAGMMVVESDPTSTQAVKTFIERWLQKNKGKGASLRDHDDPKCVLTYACAQTYGEGKRFQKDAITCGVYKHPKHGWTMNVTPERIDKWVKNMAKMQAKGVPIPLVKDHVVNSDTTLGYVQGGHRDGNVLRVISEVPDDESAKKLKTVNNVSIYVERDFKDGTGEVYDEAITHIALTPEPVVPGQAGFISIAASSGQSSLEVPVYSLATDQGVSPMRRELNARFRELVKAATDRAEDDLLADVDEFITSKMEENNRLTEEVSSLKGQLEALASVDHTTSTLTEDEAEERTNDVVEELDDMVGKGMLTPALAASLRGTLCGDASARNDYMLSRCEAPNERGIRPVRAKQLLSLIKQIKPMKLGSQTQGQGMSRSTPEPEGNKLTDRLVAIAQPTDPKSLVM